MARHADIVLIQATHAIVAGVVCECAALTRGLWWSASACAPVRAGGLFAMVPRGLLGEGEAFDADESVPGRVAHLRLTLGQAQIDSANMHNYGMAIAGVNRACAEVRRRSAFAGSAPTWRIYILGGDFNIELGCGPNEGAANSGLHRPRELSRAPASLRAACEAMTELSQPSPTKVSHSDTTMSRIDGVFSSAPG